MIFWFVRWGGRAIAFYFGTVEIKFSSAEYSLPLSLPPSLPAAPFTSDTESQFTQREAEVAEGSKIDPNTDLCVLR